MSTPSYGSIEASEAPDQGPRRRRIVGVALALALGLAIATFSLATPVASSAELIQSDAAPPRAVVLPVVAALAAAVM